MWTRLSIFGAVLLVTLSVARLFTVMGTTVVRFLQQRGLMIQDDFHVLRFDNLIKISWDFVSTVNFWKWGPILIAMYLLYRAYRWLSVPWVWVRTLDEVGYPTDEHQRTKDVANEIRKRRKIGDIPPVYPNGWFALIESHRLKKNEVKSVNVLGLNLAVFRDSKGEAHAVDAYCPHLGANLAVGGRVVGDCLECPFHEWRFRGEDGKCTKIPYSEKIPEIAKVKSWPVLEQNANVYLWYHAEDADPLWFPPEIEEINSGEWINKGMTEHVVNAHIQEIPENGADAAHLMTVHGPMLFSEMWNQLSFMHKAVFTHVQHTWNADWQGPLPAPNQHLTQLTLTHTLKLFGVSIPFIDVNITAQQVGPGIVYLKFRHWLWSGVFLQSVTPMGPLTQRVVHQMYADKHYILSKFLILCEALQLERDIVVWNNKKFLNKPLLVKSPEDERIGRYRRWYSQFYSENSPKLTLRKDTLDW